MRQCGAGYGSYGPPPGWGHGARVIVLRQGQDAAQAETWIRLENGARVDQEPDLAYRSAAQTVCEAGAGLLPLGDVHGCMVTRQHAQLVAGAPGCC